MHKLICLNAYSLRNTAFSIVFKSYHLTQKVNVKGSVVAIIQLVFVHFSIFETANFKLVLHLYARQMMFGCFVLFPSKREKKMCVCVYVYISHTHTHTERNANKIFINVTVTIPQSGKKKRESKKPKCL